MKRRKMLSYLRLQIKRVFHCMPIILALTLLLAGGMILVGVGTLKKQLTGEEQQMIELGVVGATEEVYFQLGMSLLQELDTSRYTIQFHEMEENEARDKLEAGVLTAYFVIPEGFVDSVFYGDNYTVEYYVRNGQAGVTTMLMQEFSEIVSDMLVETQDAIHGMRSLCKDYGLNDRLSKSTEELNLEYIEFVLKRPDIYQLQELGISNDLSTVGYYVCGFIVLFLMLWEMNGCLLYIRKDMALSKLLLTDDRGIPMQILCEYISYFMLTLVSFWGMMLLIGGVCELVPVSIPEWGTVDIYYIMDYGWKLIPMIAMLTAMAFVGHEVAEDIISGMLLQFFTAVVMGYLSGCFYPNSFFPKEVQILGKWLPSGVGMNYASQCMRDDITMGILGIVVCYTVIFLLIAMGVRKLKLTVNE